jgi:prepilin-type N-terminal cleavage/methylation domain-containing protein
MHTLRQKPRDEAGFSLLELVVVAAILTVIMGAAFGLMADSQESFDRNQILAEAHQNADFAVLRVTELLRSAGSNPNGITTVNSLTFLSNKDYGSTTVNTKLLRILSDLDCDGFTTSRVSNSGSQYYILSSEDVTLKYYQQETTDQGVTVPAYSLCMKDNTAGSNPSQFVPVVLASNVLDFTCTVGSDPREVTVAITAGPSHPIPTTDPRYVTFTRTSEIRLRNRN